MTILEELKNLENTEEGKKMFKEFGEKLSRDLDRKNNNIIRLKSMFYDQNSFDNLVNRIIEKHDERWDDLCYNNGCLPYPHNLMYTLFELSELDGNEVESIDDLTKNFPSVLNEYMGWVFSVTHGQGSVCSIYKNNKLIFRI